MKAPIFIVGTPRSGTTLLARILGRHSRIFVPAETQFFEDIYARRKDLGGLTDRRSREQVIERLRTIYERFNEPDEDQRRVDRLLSDSAVLATLQARASTYGEAFSAFMEMQMLAKRKARWGNHVPRDIFNVEDILALFPEAKIVVCVRDLRDFLASYKGKWKVTSPTNVNRLRRLYHPILTSLLWRASVKRIPFVTRRVAATDLALVRYEELVASPRAVVEGVCRVIGECFEEDMLNIDTHNSSGAGERRGIFSTSVQRWRKALSPEEVAVAQWVAGRELTAAGYTLESVDARVTRVIGILVSFPWSLCRSVLVNRGTRGPLMPYLLRRSRAILART
jgi:hypothetical protein